MITGPLLPAARYSGIRSAVRNLDWLSRRLRGQLIPQSHIRPGVAMDNSWRTVIVMSESSAVPDWTLGFSVFDFAQDLQKIRQYQHGSIESSSWQIVPIVHVCIG